MSSNLPPVVPVFSGMQFNSGFYTPNTEPLTYEQMTTTFVEYPTAQGDVSMRSAVFSGDVVVTGDLSVNGTINGSSGGGGTSIITTSTMDVSNQITSAGDLVLSTSNNYIDVITNTLNGASYSAFGSGFNNTCTCIAIDPSTGDVYAGGTFTEAGGTAIHYLAQWNGTAWSVVGDKIFDVPILFVTFIRWFFSNAWNISINVLTDEASQNGWAYSLAPAYGANTWQWIRLIGTPSGQKVSAWCTYLNDHPDENPSAILGYTSGIMRVLSEIVFGFTSYPFASETNGSIHAIVHTQMYTLQAVLPICCHQRAKQTEFIIVT
jgi:hypothetical protein